MTPVNPSGSEEEGKEHPNPKVGGPKHRKVLKGRGQRYPYQSQKRWSHEDTEGEKTGTR